MHRGHAAAATWIICGRVAATPRLRRAESAASAPRRYGELDDRVAAAEAFVDRGDISEPSFDDIKGAVAAVAADGLAPLVLGGDHSITHPAFEAVRDRCDAILHVDAHSDTRGPRGGPNRSPGYATPPRRRRDAAATQPWNATATPPRRHRDATAKSRRDAGRARIKS